MFSMLYFGAMRFGEVGRSQHVKHTLRKVNVEVLQKENHHAREGQEREDDDTVKKDEEMLSTLTCNGHSCTPVGGLGCARRT